MKQETYGAGGVYLSSGREKSECRCVDFDSRPNQISEKSLWNSFIIYKGIIYILKRNFNINNYRVDPEVNIELEIHIGIF